MAAVAMPPLRTFRTFRTSRTIQKNTAFHLLD